MNNRDILINIDSLRNIQEITLENTPNSSFSINVDNKEINIEIRTFTSEQSFITISTSEKTLCNYSNIKAGVDLVYTGGVNFVIFFNRENDLAITRPYNYTDFNTNIRLYYADIQ